MIISFTTFARNNVFLTYLLVYSSNTLCFQSTYLIHRCLYCDSIDVFRACELMVLLLFRK